MVYTVSVKTKDGRTIKTTFKSLEGAKREVSLMKRFKDPAFQNKTLKITTPTGKAHKPLKRKQVYNPFGSFKMPKF